MKKRAVFLVVFLVAAFLIVFLGRKRAQKATRTEAPATQSLVGEVTNTQTPGRQLQPTVADAVTKRLKTLDDKRTLNHANIEFFGKLEDQFGNSLPNTDVEFNIRYDTGLNSGTKNGTCKTDAKGFFSLAGYQGESLSIHPKKPGYVMIATNGGFIYSSFWPIGSRHTPDRNNPVVIRMWKLQGAEELIRVDRTLRFPMTNVPIYLDLESGNQVQGGGDLKITISRGSGEISKQNPREWSVRLEAVNGGIVETDGVQFVNTFSAPETNYPAFWEHRMNPQERAWFDNLNAVFFLRSRNGQLNAKFRFFIRMNKTDSDKVGMQISGLVNAHGSRNWEEDPSKIRGPQ